MEINELNRMIQRLKGDIEHVKKQVGVALRTGELHWWSGGWGGVGGCV